MAFAVEFEGSCFFEIIRGVVHIRDFVARLNHCLVLFCDESYKLEEQKQHKKLDNSLFGLKESRTLKLATNFDI